MKITKRQLRKIIKEERSRILREQADPRAMELESLINGWISQPITVEFVRGISYMVKGVEPAMIPEVTEEVEEFGGSVVAELSSGTTPGLKDLSIML